MPPVESRHAARLAANRVRLAVQVGAAANPRSLANFPMQANGAEMLRLACCLATERGHCVCCPVHDALLVEGPADEIEDVVAETQAAMHEASRRAGRVCAAERCQDRLLPGSLHGPAGRANVGNRNWPARHDSTCTRLDHPTSRLSCTSLMQVPAPVWPTRAFLLLFLLDIRYMDPPDIDRFRIQSGDVFLTKAKRSRGRLPRRQKGEWFLKGPIPGAWLTSAASLPGKALHVALAAWTEAMMKRSATVTLTHMAANRLASAAMCSSVDSRHSKQLI